MQDNIFFLISTILGLIQVAWLPGWLISFVFYRYISKTFRIFLSFIFSLIFNTFTIFILTLAHLYTKNIFLTIIIIEIIVLLILERRSLKRSLNQNLSGIVGTFGHSTKTMLSKINNWIDEEILLSPHKNFRIISITLSSLTIIYLVYLFISNVGTLFNLSDAIFSWNRWAVQWSNNILPTDTWEYPQLLPTNWSIFYLFMGKSGELMAKMIMPIFPILSAISLLYLGIIKKRFAFILSIFTIFFLTRMMNGYEIMATEGYADTAVSFFSLIPILILYYISDKETSIAKQEYISKLFLSGTIFVIAALLTKQTGIFIAIYYPIIFVYLFKNQLSGKKIFKILVIYIASIVGIVLPYYIYKEISIILGNDISVIPTINSLIHGQNNSWFEIFYKAIFYTIKKTYFIIILYFLSTLYLLFREKSDTLLFSLPAIIMTLFWSLFLAYDSRNLTLGIFFLGICLSIVIELFFSKKKNTDSILANTKIYQIIILFIILITIFGSLIRGKIDKHYYENKRTISNKELSINISTYFAQNKDDKKIYSNFALLHFLPDTKDKLLELNPEHFTNADNFEKYFETIKRDDIGYILAANYSSKEIKNDIYQKIQNGKFTRIFEIDGFILAKINNKK